MAGNICQFLALWAPRAATFWQPGRISGSPSVLLGNIFEVIGEKKMAESLSRGFAFTSFSLFAGMTTIAWCRW